MKSFKVSITSILLSFFTLGSVYTQTAPKLAMSVHTGLAGTGAAIGFGLRGGLGNHLALSATVGTLPLKFEASPKQLVEPAYQPQLIKIKGLEAYTFGLTVFSKHNQAGFYGGFGFGRQRFQVESRRLVSSQAPTPLQQGRGNLNYDLVSFESVNMLMFTIGYAFILYDNSRLEIGFNNISRNRLNQTQLTAATSTGIKKVDIRTGLNRQKIGIELRYVKPIF